MLSKTQFLEVAFNRAVNQVDVSRVAPELNERIIRTNMEAFADKEGMRLSKDEIDKAIVEGLTVLSKAGDDFRYQDWTMLR